MKITTQEHGVIIKALKKWGENCLAEKINSAVLASDNMFKVGQELYYVFNDTRMGLPVWRTITKIGNTFIYLGRYKVDKTLLRDDYGSYYLTKEAYNDKVAYYKKWSMLTAFFRNHNIPPADFPIEKINEIIELIA